MQLGVDLNVKDRYNFGRTALHLAASNGNLQVLKMLI